MRYNKGDRVLVAVTYEIEIELEEDVNSDDGIGELTTAALLASGDLDSHCTTVDVLGVNGASPEDDVSRETDDVESEEWTAAKEAVRKWEELREGNDRANHPDLNPNQIQFVCDVIAAGLGDQLRTYSGRGMYGRYCPGVTVDHPSEVPTKVRYSQDSMGLSHIIYMP